MSQSPLIDALCARAGIVCLVGAGGKKSAIYRLAALNPGRVGITSTVHIPPFPDDLVARRVVERPDQLERSILAQTKSEDVAFACPSDKRKRLSGVDPDRLAEIHSRAGFVATYVKADGARFRWIKAPSAREPQIVTAATTVIPVVSARAIGQPLGDRVAHHPERVAEIAGLALGGPICPEHVGRLLGSELGALKGIPESSRIVPLINMVDDGERVELAREAAVIALARSDRFDHVVLASLQRDEALVEVVTRSCPVP